MSAIKIGILSDIHAEFWQSHHIHSIGNKIRRQLADADLILFAGDIDNGPFSIRTARDLFPTQPICLVAGNHEFYQRAYLQTLTALTDEAAGTNVFFLHRTNYVATINGRQIRILGVTLWTDFALFGTPDLSMIDAKAALNDFRLIRDDATGRSVTPAAMLLWHQADKAWLLTELDKPFDGTTIVMTHHAPVNFAIQAKFVNDRIAPCFASRLEHVLVRDDVDLVVWGHTHHSVDQTIGKTRFVSNQTGYVRGIDLVETDDFGVVISI